MKRIARGASSCENPFARLIDRLERSATLSGADKGLLQKLPINIRSVGARDHIVRHGDRPSECSVLLDGQLIKSRIADNYRRQILSFHVAGDLPDFHSLFLGRAQHDISSLGQTIVGFIPHQALRDMLSQSPTLAAALWRDNFVEAGICHEWAIGLASREATTRIAHLICEIVVRLGAVNRNTARTLEFPWTQQDLGDACGLSNVHVNRVIQTLRTKGLISWRSKIMTIQRWDDLVQIAGFSPDYLFVSDEVIKS